MSYEDFDEIHELSMVGGMGSIHTICEYDKKLIGKKRVYKRPIGFICNFDILEPAE